MIKLGYQSSIPYLCYELKNKTMKTVKNSTPSTTSQDLNSMTVANLKAQATEMGFGFSRRVTKNDLMVLINAGLKKEAPAAKKEAKGNTTSITSEEKKAKKEAKAEVKAQEVKKVKAQVAKKDKEAKDKEDAKVTTFDALMTPEVTKMKRTANKNREAYKTLKIMKVAIAKGAFNPDTDYKELLKAESAPKDASKAKAKGKDKVTNKDASETKQSAKKDKSPSKKVKVPTKTRMVMICDTIKNLPKKGLTIDKVAEQANESFQELYNGSDNEKQTKHTLKVIMPVLVAFGIVTVTGGVLIPGK